MKKKSNFSSQKRDKNSFHEVAQSKSAGLEVSVDFSISAIFDYKRKFDWLFFLLSACRRKENFQSDREENLKVMLNRKTRSNFRIMQSLIYIFNEKENNINT